MVEVISQQQVVGEGRSRWGEVTGWHQQVGRFQLGRTRLILPFKLIELLYLVYVLILDKHQAH